MDKSKAAVAFAFKTTGMAMGIVTIVVSAVKAADSTTYFVLAGLGLFAFGVRQNHRTSNSQVKLARYILSGIFLALLC